MENEKMENEKKVYETPEVTKVEFDASDRITASGCLREVIRGQVQEPECAVV